MSSSADTPKKDAVTAALDLFMHLSAVLTGFGLADLQGSGQGNAYFNELLQCAGDKPSGALLLAYENLVRDYPKHDERFLEAFGDRIMNNDQFGPLAQNIVLMWYCGRWNQLPRAWRDTNGALASDQDHIISAAAYVAGLVWQAIDAHPRGAKPMGYGTWALRPNVPETIPPHD